jgi:methionyl-tRNA synthetase
MNKNKFYVTTPIYYVNSKPHLGTLYSSLIADAAARWNKLMGKKVFFLTGTDEHGQKVQEKAEENSRNPKEFVDSMIPAYKKTWKRYYIEYDRFIRTTDEDHKHAVVSWINKLREQDDIYKSEYSGMYCVPCETFVNVESESFKDELGNYICPSCKRKLREVAEESYFFRLSAYENRLLEFYKQNPHFITPKERMNEVLSFVRSGLKDLSISRKTVSWGIPFPDDPTHTIYVWGDALNNYISAIGYGQDDAKAEESFNFWWPADLHVMAKDIVRFHAVYWPAFLMAAEIPLPKRLLVHGYVLVDKQKMSKSLGNAIDPEQLSDWYGIDQVRYYLLRQMAITQDGNFDLKGLEERISADLANNLGNLLNRTVSLALKNELLSVLPPEKLIGKVKILRDKCEEAYRLYWEEMNKGFFHVALADLWKFISEVNVFFHDQQPWALAKKNNKKFEEVISAACHSLYSIGIMLWPIMPKKMEQLLASIGYKLEIGKNYEEILRKNEWNKTFVLTHQKEPLFVRPKSRLDDSNVQKKEEQQQMTVEEGKKSKNGEKLSAKSKEISFEDFVKVDLRVGTIKSCESVEGSKKLYKMQIDFGKLGKRQILAGVAKMFSPEQLIDKQGVFVVNLAPRKIMGIESNGMMLMVDNISIGLERVTVSEKVVDGSRLS